MKVGTPKELNRAELRVAMTPESAQQLQKLGYTCLIEAGAGKAAGFSDDAYRAAGVAVAETAEELYAHADVIAKVRPPEDAEVERLGPGKTLISFFYPAQNAALLDRGRTRAPPSSPWTWCRASHAPRRWTRCRRWRTSPATAR